MWPVDLEFGWIWWVRSITFHDIFCGFQPPTYRFIQNVANGVRPWWDSAWACFAQASQALLQIGSPPLRKPCLELSCCWGCSLLLYIQLISTAQMLGGHDICVVVLLQVLISCVTYFVMSHSCVITVQLKAQWRRGAEVASGGWDEAVAHLGHLATSRC